MNQHVYKHYKGKYYRVLCGGAEHSESGEELVVYQQLYRSKGRPLGYVWVRPAYSFHGAVSEFVSTKAELRSKTWVATPMFSEPRQRFEYVNQVPRGIARLIKRLDRINE